MKYIILILMTLSISACGNTIVGVGKDIQKMGTELNKGKSNEK
jgi:predicted small secreted protein|tara:strand:+ start:162 stop:290 length:129 start_codon:yes stop_codon:yes gene_type:complete